MAHVVEPGRLEEDQSTKIKCYQTDNGAFRGKREIRNIGYDRYAEPEENEICHRYNQETSIKSGFMEANIPTIDRIAPLAPTEGIRIFLKCLNTTLPSPDRSPEIIAA